MTATRSAAEESPRIRDWLPTLLSGRPHQVIGDSPAEPYLLRWFLIPRNPVINIYRHRFCQSDPSVPHDHPWHFASIVLRGAYREISEHRTIVRRPGSVALRRASSRHRVELLAGPVTTVIITGPRCRRWGFWCPRAQGPPAFVPWQQFGSGGCGEYLAPPAPQAEVSSPMGTGVHEQRRAPTRGPEARGLTAAPGIVRVLIARRCRQRPAGTCGSIRQRVLRSRSVLDDLIHAARARCHLAAPLVDIDIGWR